MGKFLYIAREIILTGICIAFLQCLKPLPPPGEIPTTFDAGVSDPFSGYIADCSELLVGDRTSKALFWVQSCLEIEVDVDAGDPSRVINECMVKGSLEFTRDALICLLIDLNVEWQREIAMGVSEPSAVRSSVRANRWINDHQIGARR